MLDRSDDRIRLSVTGTVETTLAQLVGLKVINIGFQNEVVRGSLDLEVAMVLDNTGSMSGSKLSSLKKAAKDLVDTLSGGDSMPERARFAVIPFAQTVRVDPDSFVNNGWVDTECDSSIAQLNFDNGMCAYTVYETMHRNTEWAGCVEARPGDYATDDTAPNVGVPDTLFVPYFQPDEPDDGDEDVDDYTHDYLEDGSGHDPVWAPTGSSSRRGRRGGGSSGYWTAGSTELERLMDSTKYEGVNRNNDVNSSDCMRLEPIQELTNDTQAVKLAINDMQANGHTHVPLGAIWGLRALSPQGPYTEGAPYDDENVQKALIIMTDGENTIPGQSTMNGSEYTAYGYLRQGRLGTTSSNNAAVDELDDMLSEVCDLAKEMGIRVYTIGFDIDSDNIQGLLEECASDESMYFNSPTASALEMAFSAIATDLSNLRLAQ